MKNETRKALDLYRQQIAKINGVHVDDTSTKFNVAPSVQQTLESKIQESSGFLQRINHIGVDELKAAKLGLGVGAPIASRTDTSGNNERKTKDVTNMDSRDYECVKTDFDTHLRYNTLDTWAKFPDFQTRVRDLLIKRQALDIVQIGFTGVKIAADTDLAQNPNLEDVNIGWLQQIRQFSPQRWLKDDGSGQGVCIGEGGHYKNLDACIMDAVTSFIDPWYRSSNDLVVIVGRSIADKRVFTLVNEKQKPTDALAVQILQKQTHVGALQSVVEAAMPDGCLLITSFDNLSHYFQISSRRRMIADNPKKDRVENYESSNNAYVVEDFGKCALVQNIKFV